MCRPEISRELTGPQNKGTTDGHARLSREDLENRRSPRAPGRGKSRERRKGKWGKLVPLSRRSLRVASVLHFPLGFSMEHPQRHMTPGQIHTYIRNTSTHASPHICMPRSGATGIYPSSRVAFWRVACHAVATLMASFLKLYSGPYPL